MTQFACEQPAKPAIWAAFQSANAGDVDGVVALYETGADISGG